MTETVGTRFIFLPVHCVSEFTVKSASAAAVVVVIAATATAVVVVSTAGREDDEQEDEEDYPTAAISLKHIVAHSKKLL